MTTTRTFMGMLVEGDINEGDKREEQRPLEDLQPVLQALFDDDGVIEFGWRQYTPYFNDGEPCTFSTSGTWVRTDADADGSGSADLAVDYHPSLGEIPATYNRETRSYDYGAYEGPDEGRYDRAKALAKAIEGGEFLDVLLEAFGDHAKVTVRRDGIQVDFYDHD
ncbi:hypothetical protein [Streptomyces sp. CB03911]|uniref:hypothetical protein n=1 Tax=Streptomyces sp. CB03911 TaxID=1804758 RepID=UPI00093BFD22|nr:hypothetical protein [Streptomyces sp. CB03911]OKI22223.1 hypothetical protein A6A07_34685 [Streptomyces sp. CB03911]